MKRITHYISVIFSVLLLAGCGSDFTIPDTYTTYNAEGWSFSYPADWSLEEQTFHEDGTLFVTVPAEDEDVIPATIAIAPLSIDFDVEDISYEGVLETIEESFAGNGFQNVEGKVLKYPYGSVARVSGTSITAQTELYLDQMQHLREGHYYVATFTGTLGQRDRLMKDIDLIYRSFTFE